MNNFKFSVLFLSFFAFFLATVTSTHKISLPEGISTNLNTEVITEFQKLLSSTLLEEAKQLALLNPTLQHSNVYENRNVQLDQITSTSTSSTKTFCQRCESVGCPFDCCLQCENCANKGGCTPNAICPLCTLGFCALGACCDTCYRECSSIGVGCPTPTSTTTGVTTTSSPAEFCKDCNAIGCPLPCCLECKQCANQGHCIPSLICTEIPPNLPEQPAIPSVCQQSQCLSNACCETCGSLCSPFDTCPSTTTTTSTTKTTSELCRNCESMGCPLDCCLMCPRCSNLGACTNNTICPLCTVSFCVMDSCCNTCFSACTAVGVSCTTPTTPHPPVTTTVLPDPNYCEKCSGIGCPLPCCLNCSSCANSGHCVPDMICASLFPSQPGVPEVPSICENSSCLNGACCETCPTICERFPICKSPSTITTSTSRNTIFNH